MQKLKVFISYAHEDEGIKNQLDKYLAGLKRSNKIDVWADHQILAGSEWNSSILTELNEAHIVLLLISADFINSDYIWEHELKTALERHAKNEARVVPIIVRDCDWSEMPFAHLQALPAGAKPLSSFANSDEAYTQVAKAIRQVVDYMSA